MSFGPEPTQRSKPIGLWLAQAYLLSVVVIAVSMTGEIPVWRMLLQLAALIAGILAIQVRARWAYAVVVMLFATIALLAIVQALEPTRLPTAGQDGSYQAGRILGTLATRAFVLGMAAYVAFAHSPRVYFRVTSA
jgi:hypothetical protein